LVRRLLLAGALAAAALRALEPAAGSDARELHWKSVAVKARLDADGVLHIRERQHMVMTGDWNGGERAFRLVGSQRLELTGVTRIDPSTGASRKLAKGDLGVVDRYAWLDRRTLRWRSRTPADPPFRATEIVYELAYRFYGALAADGEAFRLTHDFAFAERDGVIESHVLELDLDPAWRRKGGNHLRVDAGLLPPGQGHLVRLELRYRGTGTPPTW
jgi:hypothetical protein